MLLFRRMLSLLKPHWLLFTGAWLSLILSTGANLLSPMILRSVMDDGITARAWAPIMAGTVLLVGLAIVRGLFGFTQSYWSEKVSQSFAFDLRNNLFEKIQTLSFAYHDRTQAGQLMTRLTSDVEQVRSFVASALLQFISALMLLIGSLYALFSMNWQLALVATFVI